MTGHQSGIVYVDPAYRAYYEDRLLDECDTVLNLDDTLAPFIRLRTALAQQGAEQHTLQCQQLDDTVIVMNNNSLGMVKSFHEMYFDGRNQPTIQGYSCQNLTELGKAYGTQSLSVSTDAELISAIEDVSLTTSHILFEVIMLYATEYRPRSAFGKPLDEQYPYI